jgi:hypothetical protein
MWTCARRYLRGHFDARVVLAVFEAPWWLERLGLSGLHRGRARGRACRAIAAPHGNVGGDETTDERGLVGAFGTDPSAGRQRNRS